MFWKVPAMGLFSLKHIYLSRMYYGSLQSYWLFIDFVNLTEKFGNNGVRRLIAIELNLEQNFLSCLWVIVS